MQVLVTDKGCGAMYVNSPKSTAKSFDAEQCPLAPHQHKRYWPPVDVTGMPPQLMLMPLLDTPVVKPLLLHSGTTPVVSLHVSKTTTWSRIDKSKPSNPSNKQV
jgi:hypothetical protein